MDYQKYRALLALLRMTVETVTDADERMYKALSRAITTLMQAEDADTGGVCGEIYEAILMGLVTIGGERSDVVQGR
ncbi:hypothetical protein M3D15_04705 [Pseudoclavibacter alba]|uniref:Uncharacterized protein n=1 Tax=Pseudoclavibacter albus TaxID=272241 RepID=A0ABT2HWE0_9MICO|nr:hypothetical protein [Pseudoclavibacter alba]MCT2042635.1 hypothetical protein [Pseudoclavibacter alba]